MAQHFAEIPLGFEVNQGQAQAKAEFFVREGDFGLYLTRDAAVVAMCKPTQGIARSDTTRLVDRPKSREGCGIVRMQVESARAGVNPIGKDRLPGTVNYFIGNNPARWRTGIPTYARVSYPGILPGINLVYSGNHHQLEYDFIVSPGADPDNIRLRLYGARHLKRTANGDLEISTSGGVFTMRKPTIYQVENGRRARVVGEFTVSGRKTVGFRLGRYDPAEPLIIDPVLVYSTFLGGSGFDSAYSIAADASGDVYVAGTTTSTNFPITQGAFQSQNNGGNKTGVGFVTKLNADGTDLIYSTYLGGSGNSSGMGDAVRAIAVDSAGNAYVTGTTSSTDFPVTQGVFQATNRAAGSQCITAFVAKLNPTGTALDYSTYLGGSGLAADFPYSGDAGYGIALDSGGNAYITGQTYSTNFPVTSGAFQAVNNAVATGHANAFIAKVNPTGTALVYSTYLGGSGGNQYYGNPFDSGTAIAVDSSGDAYITGQAVSTDFPVTSGAFQTTQRAAGASPGTNAFVAKLNPTGTALVYSTFLGGSTGGSADAIAIDSSGNAYIAGETSSTDFPVTTGAFQTTNRYSLSSSGTNAFVSKLNPTASALIYSTYLGGSGGSIHLSPTLGQSGGDGASGIAVDNSGDAYITGHTASPNFPVTQGAYQTVNNDQASGSNGGYNAFVTEFNPSGTALLYSTYLGGNGINPADFIGPIEFGDGDAGSALALGSGGNVYVAGNATSSDFPVTSGAFQIGIHSTQDAFVAQLYPTAGSTTAASPTVSISPAPSPATSAQPVTVAITVSGSSGATPTGTIRISVLGYGPVQSTLSGGGAAFDIPGGMLPAYSCYPSILANYVTADYIPDSMSSSEYKFASGTSAVYVAGPCFTVTPASTMLTLSQAQSQSLPVSVTGSSYSGLPLPTGTVTLSTGAYTSVPATLTGSGASLTIPAGTLSSGFNILNLSYSGDGNYVAMAQAGGALVTVGSTPNAGFTITGTSVKLQPGATTGNTSTIGVAPTGGFTGGVSLSATISSQPSGAVNLPTLSFGSTTPVNLTGTAGGTATLTISTTANGGCETASSRKPAIPWQIPGGATLAMIIPLIVLPRRRSKHWLVLLLLFACTAGGITSCGSSSGSPCAANLSTTAGTYVITITGTSGSTTSTGSMTLTVQ